MGGSGDNGYEARQVQTEEKKQKARDALNLLFGVAPSGGSAPTRAQYTTTMQPTAQNQSGDGWDGAQGAVTRGPTSVFDRDKFVQARHNYAVRGSEAEKNKLARDALYDQVRTDAYTAGQRGITEGKEMAGRENKFALFAQGLNGGSVDVDESALLDRTYNQGLIDLGGKADAARADLEGSDEQARLALLQSIDAGMDQGSALSSAAQQLKVNSDRASADAIGTDLGDLFANAGLLYTKSNYARGRMGLQQQDPFGTRRYLQPGSGGSSGTLSPTGG